MAQLFSIHATHPQPRLVRQAAELVRQGALIAYPTDSCYALGCGLGAPRALERLRRIRGVDERHHLTLMCRDVAEIASYAIVDEAAFRFLKLAGSYTFILRARRRVPRRLAHPRRKAIGVRLAGHPVARALVAALGEPLLSATLLLPGEAAPLVDGRDIRARLERELDLVIDAGSCGVEPSTVIDLTGAAPLLLRKGKGALEAFSLEPL